MTLRSLCVSVPSAISKPREHVLHSIEPGIRVFGIQVENVHVMRRRERHVEIRPIQRTAHRLEFPFEVENVAAHSKEHCPRRFVFEEHALARTLLADDEQIRIRQGKVIHDHPRTRRAINPVRNPCRIRLQASRERKHPCERTTS